MNWSLGASNPVASALIGIGASTLLASVLAALIRRRRQKRDSKPIGVIFKGWALVTGCSCGLGQKAAQLLANEQVEGIVLHSTERSKKVLEGLAIEINKTTGGRVKTRVVTADLSSASEVADLIDQIQDLAISVLINNAGFGANGQFDKIPADTQLRMISVNCSALLQLTHHVVEQHRKRLLASSAASTQPRLAVVNVGSLAGAPCGLPWQTTYAATKAFVSSFSHGIAYSLRHDGVRVLLVEPGTIVDTQFQQRSEQPKHGGANTTDSVLGKTFALLRDPHSTQYHVIPSLHDYITYYASKFLPDWLILKLGAKRGLKYSPERLR